MKKHYRHENNCLNCGTILEGKFCHNCGQENLEIKESFGHMMNHAISDYFHFDHQFFHTLKPLLFKPGYLTNEYMAGRRVQYLHPVKMYIFISVVYFLLMFQTGHQFFHFDEKDSKLTEAAVETKKDTTQQAVVIKPQIAAQKKQELLRQAGPSANTGGKNRVSTNTVAQNKGIDVKPLPAKEDTTYEQYLASQQQPGAVKRDGILKRLIVKKMFDYKKKYGERAKEVFLEEVNHNIPKMMFVLLPVFAFILRMAFWKSKKFYVEHLIYAFHLHCFLFIFLSMMMLVELLFPAGWKISNYVNFVCGIYILWYVYQSLRAVYQRSGFRTITKMAGIFIFYLAAGLACILMVLAITAVTAT